MISSNHIASIFSALAHPTRVDILKCLLPHAQLGLNFGQLAKAVSTPNSTLKHHLNEMQTARIITTVRDGRATVVALNLDELSNVLATLNTLCCSAQTQGSSTS